VKRLIAAVVVILFVANSVVRAVGDEKANAIIDHAIKAMGGEEKLNASKVITWKSQGTLHLDYAGDCTFKKQITTKGIEKYRSELSMVIRSGTYKELTVLADQKGWQKVDRNATTEFLPDFLPLERRHTDFRLLPLVVFPLKDKDYKVEAAGEEKVDNKLAVVLNIKSPDGRESKLYFDKESGLPVKTVGKLRYEDGMVDHEMTLADYKDFDGIKRATKIVLKRAGKQVSMEQVTEVKILKEAAPGTFTKPD
jgi:hypothetical protein